MRKGVVSLLSRGTVLSWWVRVGIVVTVLVVCWGLLVSAGGSYFAVVHLFYVPILMAAAWFGPAMGIAMMVLAGLLAGPLVPREVVPEAYADWAWVFRLGMFLVVGGMASWALQALHERRERLSEMYANLTRLYTSTLRGFCLALEMKDEETWAHCERVATNARLMGRRLGLPADACEALYWAGYLHDVGKLAIPSEILSKPGRLTDAEFEVVKEHAAKGEELLLSVSPSFEVLAQGVRHHHERWDGGGYPDGLAGEDIPLFGRVLGVVDVFEALTSKRPYRDAWSEADAAEVVRTEAGKHFDPALARVFLELVREDVVHVEGRHGHHTALEDRAVFDPRILRTVGTSQVPAGVTAGGGAS